jgi:hypothetical protein
MPVDNIDVKDAVGVTRNVRAITALGQGTKAASRSVTMASDQEPIDQRITTSASAVAAGIFAGITGYGILRTSPESTTIFTDPFDGGTIDTTNRWAVTGTTASQASGVLTIANGTTASAFGALTSMPTFPPPGLTFLGVGCALKLETTTIQTNTHRFFGLGTANLNTTVAPLTDAIGFEIGTDGLLYGVVYANTVRTATAAFTIPVDGAYHKYLFVYRADTIIFYRDSTDVPVGFLSYTLPNVQTLPMRVHCINGATPPASAPTFLVQAVGINDTGRNAQSISDGVAPWRKATVNSSGALSVNPPVATASGTITTQNLNPGGVATAGSAVELTVDGTGGIALQITGTWTGGLNLQVTADGTNWITSAGGNNYVFTDLATGLQYVIIPSASVSVFKAEAIGWLKARITSLTAQTGSAVITMRAVPLTNLVTLNNSIPTGNNIVGSLAPNQSINIAQTGATNVATNNGTASAGCLRVAIASNCTANSNPYLMTAVPSASQGASTTHHLISAASTNATSVKASNGTISSGCVSNLNAAARYFKLYNKASAPTVGTDTPVLTLYLRPTANEQIPTGEGGFRLSTGIAYALTTGIAVADTGAVAASEHSVHIAYT